MRSYAQYQALGTVPAVVEAVIEDRDEEWQRIVEIERAQLAKAMLALERMRTRLERTEAEAFTRGYAACRAALGQWRAIDVQRDPAGLIERVVQAE